MICLHCDAAQTLPHYGGFHANCMGCSIRALASGLEYYLASESNTMTAGYRSALQRLFAEKWRDGHAQVKAERARMDAMLNEKEKA